MAPLTATLLPTEAWDAERRPEIRFEFIGEVRNGKFPDHLRFEAYPYVFLAIRCPVRTHPNRFLHDMHRVDDYANFGLAWTPDGRKLDFSLFFRGDPNFDGSGGNALFPERGQNYRLGDGDVFPIYDELYLASTQRRARSMERREHGT